MKRKVKLRAYVMQAKNDKPVSYCMQGVSIILNIKHFKQRLCFSLTLFYPA
jgi:hypothetical protein